MQKRVHAVILNYHNSAASLQARAELQRSRDIDVDVLVVDCDSPEPDRARLRSEIPADRLLLLPENRGYAGGMNAGVQFWLERAPAVAVLLVTPDARLPEDAAHGLWQALAHAPRVGVTGPVVVYQQQPQRMGAGVLIDARGRVRRLEQIRDAQPYAVDSLDGCCMLLHPDAWRAVNGFDEQYFLYFEETDFCQRVRRAGWRVCVAPGVIVQHPKSRNSAAPHVYYYMARNTYRFRAQHYQVGTWRAAAGLAASNLWLTAIALGATVLPQRWGEARDRWRNSWRAWRGAWQGTRDHLKGRYGPQPRG